MRYRVMDRYDSYERARTAFSWELPDRYNPARDLCRKHDPDRVALRYTSPNGETEALDFGTVDDRSDRLAAAFQELGIGPGDRIGVVVPQKPANPITHLANWKLGAVSVPLTVLFGTDALQYRLADSEATAVVVDASVRETIESIRPDCPALEHVIVVGSQGSGETHRFEALLAEQEPGFDWYESTPQTESAIMYTSGSTGPPKGVVHSHALWLGRAAAAYTYFDRGLEDAVVWTPADWAWGAALGGTLFAGWHYGAPVVGWPRAAFDPDAVFELLQSEDITHTFMPPTALRMLMRVDEPDRFDLSLSTIASAGEPLTPEIVEWVEQSFEDVSINEFYGQTELNLVVGNSSWFDTQPGSMGKPLPGYETAVLDPDSHERQPVGEVGELAVKPGYRRVFFEKYLGLPEKTAAKQTEHGWFLTGDLVRRDDDGYLWFVSRADDVILTRGYRVGPMEVESAILDHPAVEQVGVVGVPDELTGEAIKAFVQPVEWPDNPARLREVIQTMVRENLAEYEYPDQIEFVDQLPTTSTGKIRRESLRE